MMPEKAGQVFSVFKKGDQVVEMKLVFLVAPRALSADVCDDPSEGGFRQSG